MNGEWGHESYSLSDLTCDLTWEFICYRNESHFKLSRFLAQILFTKENSWDMVKSRLSQDVSLISSHCSVCVTFFHNGARGHNCDVTREFPIAALLCMRAWEVNLRWWQQEWHPMLTAQYIRFHKTEGYHTCLRILVKTQILLKSLWFPFLSEQSVWLKNSKMSPGTSHYLADMPAPRLVSI